MKKEIRKAFEECCHRTDDIQVFEAGYECALESRSTDNGWVDDEKLNDLVKDIISEFIDRYNAEIPYYPHEMKPTFLRIEAVFGDNKDVAYIKSGWSLPAPPEEKE